MANHEEYFFKYTRAYEIYNGIIVVVFILIYSSDYYFLIVQY